MTFDEFQRVNAERCAVWHGGVEWGLNEWAVAMAGECGEACNIIKKLNRYRDGLVGNSEEESREALDEALADELADTVTYAFLLADAAGINLGEACALKFNRVSEKHGLGVRVRR